MQDYEIHTERVRAHAKHSANGNSMEDRHWTDQQWLPVLVEEVGEVAKCLCEGLAPSDLRKELIQVLAMASAWVDAIDK